MGFWVDKKGEVVYNFRYKSACVVRVFCVINANTQGLSWQSFELQ